VFLLSGLLLCGVPSSGGSCRGFGGPSPGGPGGPFPPGGPRGNFIGGGGLFGQFGAYPPGNCGGML